jgi:Fe-Mn family superoxide dismutase
MATTHSSAPANYEKLLVPTIDWEFDDLKLIPRSIVEQHYNFHKTHVDEYNTAVEFLPACRRRSSVASDTSIQQSKIDMLAESHMNYCLFWKNLSPPSKMGGKEPEPTSELGKQIIKQFGSVDELIDKFDELLESIKVRGWGFLVKTRGGKELKLITTDNDKTVPFKYVPLLAIDAWDHSLESQYNMSREKYFAEIWDVINWHEAERRFNEEGL